MNKTIVCMPDKRIFNLYSYLSSMGYVSENNKEGIHQVRKQIIAHFKECEVTQSKYKNFYDKYFIQNPVHLIHFNTYVLCLNNKFELEWENYSTNLLPSFNNLLKDFYFEFSIEKLWNKYKEAHINICDKYYTVARRILPLVEKFIYGNKPDIEIIIIVNLLESYYRNKSILINKALYLVYGPNKNEEVNVQGLIHEYLHLLVNPITARYESEINKLEVLFNNTNKSEQIKSSYNSVKAYTTECIVRGITLCIYEAISNLKNDDIKDKLLYLEREGFNLAIKYIS